MAIKKIKILTAALALDLDYLGILGIFKCCVKALA